MFAVGLLVRLAGLALIVLGDGHDAWWAKGLVIVGVAAPRFPPVGRMPVHLGTPAALWYHLRGVPHTTGAQITPLLL